jgi:hypothetical protein
VGKRDTEAKLFSLSAVWMEERQGGGGPAFIGLLLSPTLSSLVPREEREKSDC